MPPAADSDRRMATSDEAEAQRYLAQLRDGSPEQQIAARAALAAIFERRGMLAEATELYERNIRAGVRSGELYTRLASLYRRQGLFELADEALAAAARLSRPAAPPLVERAQPPAAAARRRGVAPAPLLFVTALALLAIGVSLTGWSPADPLFAARRQEQQRQATATAMALLPTATATPLPPTTTPVPTPTLSPTPLLIVCSAELGFAQLRLAIGPDAVGDCLEQPRPDSGGTIHQRTAKGEFVYRKSDNRAAFTNGFETWLVGPSGLQRRPNTERFPWEATPGPIPRPTSTPFPLPTPLPGAILPAHRIVAYYGNPLAPDMGVLGEAPAEAMLARLKQQAEAYTAADPARPALPALHLVASVAQDDPGPEGLYRARMPPELIEKVALWAESNEWLLILDVQVGRSSVAAELEPLLPFLKRRYVHLALDPEFAMGPDKVPGQVFGTMDATTINGAIRTVADLVAAENLPPKVLIVHRFTEEMITNATQIQLDPRVQVVIDMDGFGDPEAKISHYNTYVRDQRVAYTGIKLFYKHDVPLLSPTDVLSLDPPPDVVIYQ